jgi:acyl-CoA thioesterase-1
VKRLFVLWVLTVAAVAAQAATPTILVFGDSLSAGFGLSSVDVGWVKLLQGMLQAEGYGYQVVNASVSGETTGGGLARLPRALGLHHPAIVILELGANDGLRGLPVAAMRTNLAQMVNLARSDGAAVLLLGMRMPPNYGAAYTEPFHAAFGELARQEHLRAVDFLLQDVALVPGLMQADNFHPNEKGQPYLLQAVWPALVPMLRH